MLYFVKKLFHLLRNSLAVRWLGPSLSLPRGPNSTPGWGTRIPRICTGFGQTEVGRRYPRGLREVSPPRRPSGQAQLSHPWKSPVPTELFPPARSRPPPTPTPVALEAGTETLHRKSTSPQRADPKFICRRFACVSQHFNEETAYRKHLPLACMRPLLLLLLLSGSVVSDSVQPHGRQPTRLPGPWDSPGKSMHPHIHTNTHMPSSPGPAQVL